MAMVMRSSLWHNQTELLSRCTSHTMNSSSAERTGGDDAVVADIEAGALSAS